MFLVVASFSIKRSEHLISGLVCSLVMSLMFQLVAMFFLINGSNKTTIILIACGGIMIYGFYVIIDLHMIVNRLDLDDYIIGAITLYIDLITMFVYILMLFGNRK